MNLEDRSSVIVVDQVFPRSTAQAAGILKVSSRSQLLLYSYYYVHVYTYCYNSHYHTQGDVLMRINNVRVSSIKQVEKQIQKTKGNRY